MSRSPECSEGEAKGWWYPALDLMKNGEDTKKVAMFCGKGGVGKTTCAAITALHYAMQGKKTLIISTDFTPSLKDVFEIETEERSAKVIEGLHLHEIGFEEVKNLWEGKFGSEVYKVASTFVNIKYKEFVDFISTILPGIRDEFMVDYIRELSKSGEYDKIIWDTAPAGQTLGLLRMPYILNQHLKPAPRIYSTLRSTIGGKRSVFEVIRGWEKLSNKDINFLKKDVRFTLVVIPEALAVSQLEDIFSEFQSYGLNVDNIIVNQVIGETDSEFLQSRAAIQQPYISEISSKYKGRINHFPLSQNEVKGVEKLKKAMVNLFDMNKNYWSEFK